MRPESARARAEAAAARRDKYLTFSIIYLSLFLDNVLLTVVVPIIPDYLHVSSLRLLADTGSPLVPHPPPPAPAPTPAPTPTPAPAPTPHHLRRRDARLEAAPRSTLYGIHHRVSNESREDGNARMEGSVAAAALEAAALDAEGVSVGVLLSLKALVQLALNPLVGVWSGRVGCRLPVLVGSLALLLASLLFAWGASFWWLALGRAVQGAGSASLGVAGMCLAADLFAHDAARSRAMGVLLGSVALGVLVGYPFGGVTYALAGKAAPFLIIAACVLVDILLQLVFVDFSVDEQTLQTHDSDSEEWCAGAGEPEAAACAGACVGAGAGAAECRALLRDAPTAAALAAIFSSTCAMAVLEPCLPIWLMTHFKPEKWQLGTVFVPDSLGYLLATNVFGGAARALGRARVAVLAVALLGLTACTIPAARSVRALLVPHALLGAALGAADAALVPALAARAAAASRTTAALFSLHQTAVSAAYFIAPLLGGELTHALGFAWCLRLVGGANLLCAAHLYLTFRRHGLDHQESWDRLEDDSSEAGSEHLALAPRPRPSRTSHAPVCTHAPKHAPTPAPTSAPTHATTTAAHH